MRWLPIVWLAACQEPFSNEDILFLKALPRDLAVDVPGDADTTKRGLRPQQGSVLRAQFYDGAVDVASGINVGVFGILTMIDMVTDMPTTIRIPDRRVWGPFQPEPATPVELLLVVDRIRTSTTVQFTSESDELTVGSYYRYAISARSTGTSTAAWRQLIGGSTVLLEPDEDEAAGQLTIDFEAIRAFNPEDGSRGGAFVAYDFQGPREIIELRFIGPDSAVEDLITDPDVTFRYARDEDDSGQFTFVSPDEDGLNVFNVLLRWVPSQAGRADVEICGPGVGPIAFYAAECWSEAFDRTWLLSNYEGLQPPFGSIEGCAEGLRDGIIDAGPCK
jgi:hypothetical protein